MNVLRTLVLSVLVLAGPAFAEGTYPAGSQKLVNTLKVQIPNLPIETVLQTPVPNLYAVHLTGGQVLYGTADGTHMIAGDMYALAGGVVNLAEQGRAVRRKALMDAVPREDMVVFSPKGETKTHVSVFTDVDCGYCRKLHQEMADINALGIEVRYLAYPRAGFGTPTYAKIVSAWCADEKNEAMTALKAGLSIPNAECDNPVQEQYQLGQEVGVTGTPAIVTADGRLLPGYMPADRLAEAIGLD